MKKLRISLVDRWGWVTAVLFLLKNAVDDADADAASDAFCMCRTKLTPKWSLYLGGK